jgi:hypothetical protein
MSKEKEPQKIISEILTLLDGQSEHMCSEILNAVKEKLENLCILNVTLVPSSQSLL